MDIDSPEWFYPPNREQYDELRRRVGNAMHEVEQMEAMLVEEYESEPDKSTRKLLSYMLMNVTRIKKRLKGESF